jgi:CHAD domain-containing protein
MDRTLEELAGFRSDPTADAVHDLRVALRRCRSVASAIEEIDPHPDWEEMRACAKKLFRSLGELRDAQVLAEWLKEIHPSDEPVKQALLEKLSATEKSAHEKASRQAERFDAKRWRILQKSLRTRIRCVPTDSDAANCLAFERLEEAKELHRRALRTEASVPWHTLRIGVKRFRYTVESLLPAAHEAWAESLKRVQDTLGDIHDLDVLADSIKQLQADRSFLPGYDWQTHIAARREENLQTYRQLSLGTVSVWQTWLSGFPRENRRRYSDARIVATRKALDPKPARSLAVARLAKRIWSQLRSAQAGDQFSGASARRILEAAARLSGIRPREGRKERAKNARNFLLDSPLPPAWSFAEWERAAWVIRFQRGPEPGPENKRFSNLSAEQQADINVLAGVLRLAITLQKLGASSGKDLRIENLSQRLLLHVSGVEDTPENAAAFSETKRVLERSLGRTILVQAEPGVSAIAAAAEPPQPISIVR